MRAKAKPTVTLNTRIPAELHEQFARVLRELEQEDDTVTIQWAVEQALGDWVEHWDAQLNPRSTGRNNHK